MRWYRHISLCGRTVDSAGPTIRNRRTILTRAGAGVSYLVPRFAREPCQDDSSPVTAERALRRFACFRRTGLGVILQGKCVALAGPPNRVVGAPAMASALHQQLVSVLRRRHLSRRIEKADRLWIMAFLRFHRGNEGWRHLRSMWAAEVEASPRISPLSERSPPLRKTRRWMRLSFSAIRCLRSSRGLSRGAGPALETASGGAQPSRVRSGHRRESAADLSHCRTHVRQGTACRRGLHGACDGHRSRRLQPTVRRGQGDKVRVTPLPERIVDQLRALIDARRRRHAADVEAVEGWLGRASVLPSSAGRLVPRGASSGTTCLPRST